jgi:hypothetical protein
MSERASVFEGVQIGVEDTPGTAVTTTKRLLGFKLTPTPVVPRTGVRAQGNRFTREQTAEKEHTTAEIAGNLCYNDLPYLLSAGMKSVSPSTPARNGTFVVTLNTPTGGSFPLTFNGQTAAAIAYNVAAADLKSLLEALTTIGAGNVGVSGSAGGPYTISFEKALRYTPLALTGTAGTLITGAWTVTIVGTDGTFTMTFDGQTTSGLDHDITSAALQTALEALSSVGQGNVTVVTGGAQIHTVTFATGYKDHILTGDGANLIGTNHSLTVASKATLTVTTTAATLARLWTVIPTHDAGDTIKTYSVNTGNGVYAERFDFGVVSDLGITFTRTAAGITGRMFGRQLVVGETMDGGTAEVAMKPVSPTEVSVWAGTTMLGMAQLERLVEARINVANMQAPLFTLDDVEPSFTAVIEPDPGMEITASITVEANTDADAYILALRLRTLLYVRFEAVGELIETGYVHRIRIDMPFKVRNPGVGDDQGARVRTYELEPIYDSTFGGAIAIYVMCSIATL